VKIAAILLLIFALSLGGWAFYDYEQHNGPDADALRSVVAMNERILDNPNLQTPEAMRIEGKLRGEFLAGEAAKHADESRGIIAVLAFIASVAMITTGRKLK
jgi:hypothetical protein